MAEAMPWVVATLQVETLPEAVKVVVAPVAEVVEAPSGVVQCLRRLAGRHLVLLAAAIHA